MLRKTNAFYDLNSNRSELDFALLSDLCVNFLRVLCVEDFLRRVKSKPIHQTRNTVFQSQNMKIDKKAQPLSSELEIRKKLCLVNGKHSFDGLEFDNNFTLDEKIEPIAKIDVHSIVAHG